MKILKNNTGKELTDLEWVEEFYNFLQGEVPSGIYFRRGYVPKLSKKKAFSIIYYLQEHFSILPDSIEKCYACDELYDSDCEGLYWESKGRHYCACCCDLVPRGARNL